MPTTRSGEGVRHVARVLHRAFVCGFLAALGTGVFPGVALAQEIPDINGDGEVGYAELALVVRDDLRDQVVGDRNGDGLITEEDVRISIVQWYQALQGDVNGDGVIDSDDAGTVLDHLGTSGSTFEGDVTLDGQIDAADLFEVIESLGDSTLDVDERTLVETVGRLVLFANSLSSRAGAPPHSAFFSSTWPPDHDQDDSEQDWAPNHDAGLSISWSDPPDHNRSSSSLWPANHDTATSQSWPGDDHELETSGLVWPPNHTGSASMTWPDDHLVFASRRWPTGHSDVFSAHEAESPHNSITSSRWIHGQAHSLQLGWPPNHGRGASTGWDPDHDATFSDLWPPSHGRAPSSGWDDPGADPGAWPENHFVSFSETWEPPEPPQDDDGSPFRLPPLFPPNHALVTSIGDILPFFGGVPPVEE